MTSFAPPIEGGSCGITYIFRTFQTTPSGQAYGAPFPSFALGSGYGSLVMPADNRTHHLLLIVPSDAPELAALRTGAGFDRAVRAIPHTAPWADAAAHEPITPVHIGSNLTNTYRIQGPGLGLAPALGLYFLGDSTCTLNPANGRSLALHVPHAKVLLDNLGLDPLDLSLMLDQWAQEHIRPWWVDHGRTDASILRRMGGQPLSPDEPLASDVIVAAAAQVPEWRGIAGRFSAMHAGPEILDHLRDPVAQMLRGGWRPPVLGPARAELVAAPVGSPPTPVRRRSAADPHALRDGLTTGAAARAR